MILGDIIHNLRSALDILWNTMIRRLNGDDTLSYFPVCEKREELEGTILKADKVVTPAIPGLAEFLLNEVKLYKTGNPKGTDTIYYLNKLNRADKHRLLVATGKVTGFSYIRVFDKGNNLTNLRNVRVKDGITEIPAAFPLEFKELTYSKPTLSIFFDMPDVISPTVSVFKALSGIGSDVTGLTHHISELWRKTGRT